jgi:hypothetical protein
MGDSNCSYAYRKVKISGDLQMRDQKGENSMTGEGLIDLRDRAPKRLTKRIV